MKIRSGFVSNSSSSSFIVFGNWVDELPDNQDELDDKGISCYEDEEDGACVGVSIDIKDDETWGQFKVRTAKVLTDAGIPSQPEKMRICYGSYYC